MVAIAQSGELAQTPLPQLLLDLHRARFDGCLRLTREHAEKAFRFQRGEPVVAESNLASERLGVKLMDTGVLGREDHLRVSRHMQAKSCKEGTALLDLGLIEPRALFSALKEQVRARIVDCFAWVGGQFQVDPSDTAPEGATPFRADVYALVQEGIETHWATDRILADLSEHMDQRVARNRRLPRIQERLRHDPDVQTLIDALDGSHTLGQVLERVHSPRARAAAWLLHAVHAWDFRDPVFDGPAYADCEVEIVITDSTQPAPPPVAAASRADGQAAQRNDDVGREIDEKFETLGQLDHYALLGIDRRAPTAAIRAAYLEAARRFHPDTLARAGLEPAQRARAGKVFAAIGRAQGILSNAERRKDYDASLASSGTDLDTEHLVAAERHFRKAEVLLKQGNYRGALAYLRPAAKLWPEEPAYQAALGWALFKQNPPAPEDAAHHLQIALELAPHDAETREHLAIVRRALEA